MYIAQHGGEANALAMGSDEERAAVQAMTEEMREAAEDDPDAREMTADMLAHPAPSARLERSRAKRQAAARVVVEQPRAEAAREREDIGKETVRTTLESS